MSGQAMIKKEYKVKSSASGQRRREKAGDMLNPTVPTTSTEWSF